jgi:hypothetical protein
MDLLACRLEVATPFCKVAGVVCALSIWCMIVRYACHPPPLIRSGMSPAGSRQLAFLAASGYYRLTARTWGPSLRPRIDGKDGALADFGE